MLLPETDGSGTVSYEALSPHELQYKVLLKGKTRRLLPEGVGVETGDEGDQADNMLDLMAVAESAAISAKSAAVSLESAAISAGSFWRDETADAPADTPNEKRDRTSPSRFGRRRASTPAAPVSSLTRGRSATVGAIPVAPPVAAPPAPDGSGSDAAAAEGIRRDMPTVDVADVSDGGGGGVAPQQQERDVVVAAAEAVLKAAADPTIMLTPRDRGQARRDCDEMERDREVAPRLRQDRKRDRRAMARLDAIPCLGIAGAAL